MSWDPTRLSGDWVSTGALQEGDLLLLAVRERLAQKRTAYQTVELVETVPYGRSLVLDGSLQATQRDEFIYHESLVHPGLLASPPRGKVVVLGGGEGATLREVLKHRWVEQAVMVDIDEEVVGFCKTYLPSFHQGAFDDPRAHLVFTDARQWIENQPPGSYSAVVFDITEPLEGGPARMLFTREFYSLVRRVLVPGGIFATHAGPILLPGQPAAGLFPRIVRTLRDVFDQVSPMSSFIHSFGDPWSFVVCRAGPEPLPGEDRIDSLIRARVEGTLSAYDATTHVHMTHLPAYVRTMLDRPWDPYTDAHPPGLVV